MSILQFTGFLHSSIGNHDLMSQCELLHVNNKSFYACQSILLPVYLTFIQYGQIIRKRATIS